jgi:hypothetical protein
MVSMNTGLFVAGTFGEQQFVTVLAICIDETP